MLSQHCLCSQHVDGWNQHSHGIQSSHLLLTIPFLRKIIFHTPVGFISPTSAEKLLLEIFAAVAGVGPPACSTQGFKPSPGFCHVPTLSFPCFLQKCLCFVLLFIALSSNETQSWVLPWEQTLISCSSTSLGRLSHQQHLCRDLSCNSGAYTHNLT